ncbi:Rdx family protein [Halomicroarcula sp. S1AR25-4]|uniref:Rdx family protein n=1 Tax=Haloarcula sp. S1AR25-4 TaxID=2950538 RepID=UPI002874CE6A|nr:Rdx family protein [Halomicroarcula sp. S1AR25-4]MDS0278892.1 Rdx family protein [Halomicroarcula sp. S1AR25-4]
MHVDIEYCVPCGLRDHAIDLQTALLDEYGRDLDGVRLRPDHGGVFRVAADGETVWDKDEEGSIDVDAIVSRIGE